MSNQALLNRVGVLEAILGVDTLAAEECVGDRDICQGPCRQQMCPMQTHLLARIQQSVGSVSDHNTFLKCLIAEMSPSKEIWEKATVQYEISKLEKQLQMALQTLTAYQSVGIVGNLLDETTTRVEFLRSEIHRRQHVKAN